MQRIDQLSDFELAIHFSHESMIIDILEKYQPDLPTDKVIDLIDNPPEANNRIANAAFLYAVAYLSPEQWQHCFNSIDRDYRDQFGNNAVLVAASFGRIDALDWLVKDAGMSLDVTCWNQYSPLHKTIIYGRLELLSKLFASKEEGGYELWLDKDQLDRAIEIACRCHQIESLYLLERKQCSPYEYCVRYSYQYQFKEGFVHYLLSYISCYLQSDTASNDYLQQIQLRCSNFINDCSDLLIEKFCESYLKIGINEIKKFYRDGINWKDHSNYFLMIEVMDNLTNGKASLAILKKYLLSEQYMDAYLLCRFINNELLHITYLASSEVLLKDRIKTKGKLEFVTQLDNIRREIIEVDEFLNYQSGDVADKYHLFIQNCHDTFYLRDSLFDLFMKIVQAHLRSNYQLMLHDNGEPNDDFHQLLAYIEKHLPGQGYMICAKHHMETRGYAAAYEIYIQLYASETMSTSIKHDAANELANLIFNGMVVLGDNGEINHELTNARLSLDEVSMQAEGKDLAVMQKRARFARVYANYNNDEVMLSRLDAIIAGEIDITRASTKLFRLFTPDENIREPDAKRQKPNDSEPPNPK